MFAPRAVARGILVALVVIASIIVRGDGLGASASDVIDPLRDALSKMGVACEVKYDSVLDGRDRVLLSADDPFMMIQVIGPRDEIEKVSAVLAGSKDLGKMTVAMVTATAILNRLLGDDAGEWFAAALGSGSAKSEMHFRSGSVAAKVVVANYLRTMGVFGVDIGE